MPITRSTRPSAAPSSSKITRVRCHTSSRVTSASQDQVTLDQKFARLKRWVTDNGGYVHDALRLRKHDKAPFLTLRAAYDLDPDDVVEPCIGIPASIVVDRLRALEEMEVVITKTGCPPLYNRPTPDILALFIAYHKKRGEESMWYPAVSSLPESPPCPWLKPPRELIELEFDDELRQSIEKEKSGNDLIINQLHKLYGTILGFSKVELMWAYAQTQSISFHETNGTLWVPLAHFIQHDRTQPPLYMSEEGRFVTWGWQDHLVKAGEHLKINIGIEHPMLLYLTRGIVTDNL